MNTIENICCRCRLITKHKLCCQPCKEYEMLLDDLIKGANKGKDPVNSNVGNANANNGAFNCNANNDWTNTNGVRDCYE